MRLDLADITAASGDPRAASERLFELAVRCGAQKDGELPWHLALHLAREAAREEVAATPPESEAAGLEGAADAVLIGQALGRALGAHLRGLPSDEQAGRLVGWLVPLLRVDRRHGIDALGALCAGRSETTAAAVRDIVGVALLRMLTQLDPAAAPTDRAAPSLARDLAGSGAFALDPDAEGPGGPAWAAVVHGVFRHLTALATHTGPTAVAHWIRLCPSRSALRYVAGLDRVRTDPVLLATLLLHGGPREVAVGLVALGSVDADGVVGTAVAAFVRRAPWLAARRADWLVDQIRQVGRLGGSLADLRDAVLDRLERPAAPDAPAPVTDGLLRPVRAGMAAAAALSERAAAPDARSARLDELLGAVGATLAGEDDSVAAPDGEWTGAVARGLRGVFLGADAGRRGALRKQIVRALAAVEADLNRPAPRDAAHPPRRTAATRALAAVALRLARSLPADEDARPFALALYELALRLRAAGAGAGAADALWGAPGLIAPDPRDAAHADALADWLDAWRAADLCEGAVLPPPDVAPVATGHTLGVARLRSDAEPSSAAAAAAPAGAAGAARPSFLQRLVGAAPFSGRGARPIL